MSAAIRPIGMMWARDRANQSLAEIVTTAKKFYLAKYGDLTGYSIQVNPDDWQTAGKPDTLSELPVVAKQYILKGNIYLVKEAK